MAKVSRRTNGDGVKIKLNDDDAQRLLALLGGCGVGTLSRTYCSLRALYPGARKYVIAQSDGGAPHLVRNAQ